MSLFDENGNPIVEGNNSPTIPVQPPREVNNSIKDKEDNNYLKVDSDGEITVKVSELPNVTIETGDISVTVENAVEITNDVGNPIPIQGSVSVGNFPTTQQVSIADTVEVSIAGEPTVTISNPTTEIAVSNFPTQFDVNVLNQTTGEVEVTNFPENQTVTISNPVTDVTVSGSVSVSNFPTPVTEVSISNMVSAVDIGEATNEYIEKRYTIYSNNATFYADAMPPTADPYGRDGFHYYNNWSTGATTAQKKINWYFYDPTRQTTTYANLQGAWALVTIDRNSNRYPFFYVYGTTNGTTVTSAWTYYANLNNLVAGKTYLFYFGEEPTVYPDVPRVALPYHPNTSYGTRGNNEAVFSIAFTTDSANASGSLEIQVYELGFKANGNNSAVKLQMVNANAQTIIGNVSVTTIPPIEIADNQTVNIGTMPSIDVSLDSIEVSNFPSTQNVVIEGSMVSLGVQMNGINTSDSLNTNITNTNIGTHLQTPDGNDITVKQHYYGSLENRLAVDAVLTQDVAVYIQPNQQIEVNNDVGNPIPVSGNISVTNTPTVKIDGALLDANGTTTIAVSNTAYGTLSTQLSGNDNNVKATIQGTPNVKVTNDAASPVYVTGGVDVNLTNPQVEISNEIGNPIPVVLSSIIPNLTPLNVQGTVDANVYNVVTVKSGADSLQVDGSVSVNNFPTTQTITGTVDIGNQPIVSVNNFPTNFEISNEVGNPIPTVITNIIPNPTNPLHVQGTVDSNIVNEVTVKAGINPLQVGGTVIVDNMPSSFEINNDTGNPIPTTITNIPTVSVSSLPSITGTVTANINGIPNVNVLNTPSVNINNTPTVNANIQGTPNVNINNTPTIQIDQVTTNANRVQVVNAGSNVLSTNIFASTSPSDNTPRTVTADTVGNLNVQLRNGVNPLSIDANGVASVKFNSTQNVNVANANPIPVQVNNSSITTLTSNALGLINNSNPLHVTLVDSGTKSSSQSVGTTAGGTTQLITGIAGKKIRVFALHITGLPPSTAGTLILRSQNSVANNFFRTRYAATAIFERTFEFGTNGLLLDEVGAGIQVITSSAFAGTNLDINIIYEEV